TLAEIRSPLQEAVRRNLAARTDSFLESWEYLNGLFDPEQDVSTGIRIGRATIKDLSTWLAERLRDASLIWEWMRFGELRELLTEAGLGPIVNELFNRKLKVEDAADAFLARFYQRWLAWVYRQDAALRQFSFEDHERVIDQFRKLDRDSIRLSYT